MLIAVPKQPTNVPEPMLARLTDRLPVGPTWSYEVKWDGYRCLALKVGDEVTLRSRNASNLTASYPAVAAALRTLSARRVVLDGEIVALDDEGRPSFQALQHRTSRAGHVLVYYAFDLLQLEDADLTREPLSRRRELLRAAVAGSRVLLSEPLPGSPADIERELRLLGLEGAVAKRVDSRYEPGERSDSWLKVKFQRAQEFVIGGFTPDGNRVDALVVGYYDRKRLLAAGRVRAGLRPPARRALATTLMRLKRTTCPFANLPQSKAGRWGEGITAEDMASIVWVTPSLVAQVAFTEWTDGGALRHARFLDLRTDKRAADVVRES
jgi:bifunctional non-homologous end joining protein LigD